MNATRLTSKRTGYLLFSGLLIVVLGVTLYFLAVSKRTAPPATGIVPAEAITLTPSATEAANPLDAYKLSEPRIVLNSGGSAEIAGWSDDDSKLLIVQTNRDSRLDEIKLFSLADGTLQLIGVREYTGALPILFQDAQAIADAHHNRDTQDYSISVYNRRHTWEAITTLKTSKPYVAASGNTIAYYDLEKPQQIRLTDLKGPAEVIAEVWDNASDRGREAYYQPNQMAWSPNGDYLAVFSRLGLFLVSPERRMTYKVDLAFKPEVGQLWPYYAKWSPDGHYLAMLATSDDRPLLFMDLAILDVSTGKISYRMSMHNPERHYYTELAWAPDSRVLATYAYLGEGEIGSNYGLFFYNVATGQEKHMLSEVEFYSGNAGRNLAWSHNGKYIAHGCWHGPLCVTEVTR